MRFRSRKRGEARVGAAVAEPAPTETIEELLAEIDWLCAARRANPKPELDRRLLLVRHRAGLAMVEREAPGAEHPAPDLDRFETVAGVPEMRQDELSPQLLRGAILSRGCLLVRGLVDSDEASD